MSKWVIVDMDSASKPGEQYRIVAKFDSREEAETWVARRHDVEPDKVERGGYGIDGPEAA